MIAQSFIAPAAKPVSRPPPPRQPMSRTNSSDHVTNNEELTNLKRELADLRVAVEGTEKERDFYFNKLRDIEVMVQGKENVAPELVKDLQTILYSTEVTLELISQITSLPLIKEGFEVPADALAAEETF